MTFPDERHSNLTPVAPRSTSLDKLDNEQQSLRDLRDKLVGARFSVAAKRKELRDLHIKTGAKDGYVFNLLRQYLNEIGADLPGDIENALTDASLLRDRLGLLEVGYDEAEANYNTLEWKYSHRETRFVEELLNNKLVPSDTLDRSRSAENLEILQSTHSMTRPTSDDPSISDLTTSGDDTGTRSIEELSAFLAEQDIIIPHNARIRSPRRRSPWSNLSDLALVKTKSANRFHPTHNHLRWVEKMNDIDEWVFDIVENSPLQKLCLQAVHGFGFADTTTWWEHTKWLLIQDYSTYFHTGDSTVFNHDIDRHVSESTDEGSSSVSLVLGSCGTDQMLLGIQSSVVTDTAALPSIRESSDYQETNDQARMPRKLSAITGKEATSLAVTSQSPRRRMLRRSIATDSDGSSQHHYHYPKYARSLSFSDAPRHIERAGTDQINRNTIPGISRRKSGLQRPRNRTRLQKRHTIPEFKKAEPIEVMALPMNPDNTFFSPDNFSRLLLDPQNRNHCRRLSSHTQTMFRQCLELENSSSSATPILKPSQTKDPTSRTGFCLVM